jgi:galactose mutarotase-like enzyme
MSVILRSGPFAAKVREKGAELSSLADLSTGREYIWNGDPAWWTGSAPVLFPIVGALRGGSYTFEGKSYSLPNHGFARGSEFTIVEERESSVQLQLASSPKTLEVYPFDFTLRVGFTLQPDGLSVSYLVTNTGARRMYFSIGSHPAFVVPFAGGSLENYYVLFDEEESAERWFIRDNLIVADTTERAFTTRRTIDLSRTLFDRGALVLKHPLSRVFSLRTSFGPQAVTVSTEGAPFLGIWSKPGAAFVCIEPWHGISDSTKATGVLQEKEGILFLDPLGTFSTGYRVTIA